MSRKSLGHLAMCLLICIFSLSLSLVSPTGEIAIPLELFKNVTIKYTGTVLHLFVVYHGGLENWI